MEDEKDAGTQEEQPQPTAEEQVATLKTQLEAKSLEAENALKSVQGLRGSLKEKDKNLSEQANIRDEIDGLKDMIKVIATQRIGIEEEDLTVSPDKRVNVEKLYADLETKQDQRRKDATLKAQQDAYNTEANAIYAEAKEVFKDDKEALERVEDFLDTGKLQRAKDRVETAKVKEKPVETEAEMKARLLKELQAEDRKTETGQPSGGSLRFTPESIAKMSDEDYAKNLPAINEAIKAGNVK